MTGDLFLMQASDWLENAYAARLDAGELENSPASLLAQLSIASSLVSIAESLHALSFRERQAAESRAI